MTDKSISSSLSLSSPRPSSGGGGGIKTRKEAHEEAYKTVVKALSKDVPLLLHGSGDVVPSRVNPQTVHLVSSLTAQYIGRLVEASIASHYTFLDDPQQVFQVPPPCFPRHHRIPSKPPPFSVTHPPKKSSMSFTPTAAASSKNVLTDKEEEDDEEGADSNIRKPPRKRLREEYWDDGLVKPKIKSKLEGGAISVNYSPDTQTAVATTTPYSGGEDDGTTSATEGDKPPSSPPPQVPSMDEWVGAMGVDFREHWIRKAHVKHAIATPSFVFPICHDTYAYNRVREIRASKRTLDALLQDSTVQEMIQTEGRRAVRLRRRRMGGSRRGAVRDSKKKDDDPEDNDDDDDDEASLDDDRDGEHEWPGLDSLLPVHSLRDFGP